MADVAKVLYIVVLDNGDNSGRERTSFRYTRPVLQSTLQLMGCKARHAFKISKRVFDVMRSQCCGGSSASTDTQQGKSEKHNICMCSSQFPKELYSDKDNMVTHLPFELYTRRTTVVVRRETFVGVVCDALTEYKYVGPNQRADLLLACRIRERKESVTILLCGTSGCGKSTLSSLLGSRLGITTVVSTDSIRHMMRSFVDEKENPLLWASTYHAGECLDPIAVAEAKSKRRAKKMSPRKNEVPDGSSETGPSSGELVSAKQMAVEGFKAQSEMVIDSLDRLITSWEDRKESVVVEGVHLSLNFVMGLMKKHPSVIPFMIYIMNEDKHLERFAVRAKYMTLDPAKNKYVKYIRNIRTIQEYLCNRADKHLVPKINNTNVDKSVAAIHATVFSCLRRRESGEHLYDAATNTVTGIYEAYRNQCAANSLSSKGMFQLIQRKGSTRHLMALVNTDGSIAKAWPVHSVDGNGKPITVEKCEAVNVQFGLLGISAWPSDICGTSHASSVDDSRADGTETSSRYYSSCCSSPRMSECLLNSKELKEEQSVDGSDEEVDYLPEIDSDDESSVCVVGEMEGSVDEESTKSDEEYDDLAMQDVQESGYWARDEEPKADVCLRSRSEPSELLFACSSLLDSVRSRTRSVSIPTLSKHGSLPNGPLLSG